MPATSQALARPWHNQAIKPQSTMVIQATSCTVS